MAGIRKLPSGRYQGWYFDASRRRCFFTAGTDPEEAQKMADDIESQHFKVRVGYIPAPMAWEKHVKRPFAEVSKEYITWGKAMGGRNNGPWSGLHARNRENQLTEWAKALNLDLLGDLDGCRLKVETILAGWRVNEGLAGKTLSNKLETLAAFLDWCFDRGMLREDPLRGMEAFDTTPIERRRAFSQAEIRKLMQHTPEVRRLEYRVALLTGYRVGELRALCVKNLDKARCALTLDAEFTKNRKPAVQPIPRDLYDELTVRAEGKKAKDPLLYIPLHFQRGFARDIAAAGIPPELNGGVALPHSLRHSFITHLDATGCTQAERVILSRHFAADITTRIYTHVPIQRLHAIIDALNARLFGILCAPSVHAKVAGAEHENISGDELDLCEVGSPYCPQGSTPIISTFFTN